VNKDALDRAAYLSLPAFGALTGLQTGDLPERSVPAEDATLTLLFEHEGRARSSESIFSPLRVQAICEIEALFTYHPLYPRLCMLNETRGCTDQALSAAALFYPTPADRDPARGGCALLPAATVTARARGVLSDFFTTTNGFFATAAAQPGGYSNASRSLLRLGAPLRGCAEMLCPDSLDDRCRSISMDPTIGHFPEGRQFKLAGRAIGLQHV
jgi:hypothetical protein